MANTFRLVNNAVMSTSANTTEALYTAGSGKTAIVLGLTLANIHTSQVTGTVTVTDSSNSNETSHIVKDIPIPVGSSVEIMAGNKIVVEATDVIKVSCSVADKISATLSIMEIDV